MENIYFVIHVLLYRQDSSSSVTIQALKSEFTNNNYQTEEHKTITKWIVQIKIYIYLIQLTAKRKQVSSTALISEAHRFIHLRKATSFTQQPLY